LSEIAWFPSFLRQNYRLLLGVAVLLSVALAQAAEPFYLKGGEKIIFFGDSITQGGAYVSDVETFLRTRFPERQFDVINHGISSETISGTSEPDHNPRRPDAQVRLTRDVAAWKPDVVVACFGMNDGNYHPFDAERFAQYQAGVRRLIQRTTRDEAKARLTLMTPPPFDPYRRTASDPMATSFGYKFAAIDYDDTLKQYSDWLLTLRTEGFVVADVHAVSTEHLRRRREKQVSFFLAPDAVHPNATGHLLMAETLLLAWRAPNDAGSVEIDAAKRKVIAGPASDVRQDGDALSFTWKAPLPWPQDPQCDKQSLAIEQLDQKLNRYQLKVTGLTKSPLKLMAGDQELGQLTREDLAAGVDLLQFANLPTNRTAAEVLKLVQQRNGQIYSAWRKEIDQSKGAGQTAQYSDEAKALDKRLRELCQPKELMMRLEVAR
jgi:lysophospholipase L1-like esterase